MQANPSKPDLAGSGGARSWVGYQDSRFLFCIHYRFVWALKGSPNLYCAEVLCYPIYGDRGQHNKYRAFAPVSHWPIPTGVLFIGFMIAWTLG